MPERGVIGWDIGGAHVKAARREGGRIVDAAQWPCPLWQGMDRLDAALALAAARWPDLAGQHQAVTMTGEMVDLFEHREQGVASIAARLAEALPAPRFFVAEDYHQQYYRNHPEQGYCQLVINPKLAKFRKTFQQQIRPARSASSD